MSSPNIFTFMACNSAALSPNPPFTISPSPSSPPLLPNRRCNPCFPRKDPGVVKSRGVMCHMAQISFAAKEVWENMGCARNKPRGRFLCSNHPPSRLADCLTAMLTLRSTAALAAPVARLPACSARFRCSVSEGWCVEWPMKPAFSAF